MNTASVPANIIAIRDLLHSKFPTAHGLPQILPEVRSTGIACLDAIGLANGAITEVVERDMGCGTGLLIAALLQRETAVREPVALVDAWNSFDPCSVPMQALENLLWVRCHEVAKAMRVTDLLLRDGNMPLVILDLQAHSPHDVERVPASSWHRLRVLTEKSGAIFCTFTPCQTVPCARARLILEQRFTLDALEQPRAALVQGLTPRIVRAPNSFVPQNTKTLPALAG